MTLSARQPGGTDLDVVAQPAALPTIPWLPATLRRAWRGRDELQIGADPARAVVLQHIDADVASFIAGLDGTRTLRQVLSTIETTGRPERAARYRDVLATLAEQGLVIDLADGENDSPGLRHPMLLGPLAAEVHGRALGSLPSSPAAAMRARAGARILLVGGHRLTPALGTLLATSGMRHLTVVQAGTATASDLMPGGVALSDIGRPRIDAARDAITRAAPDVDVTGLSTGDRPDLVVLAEPTGSDSERARSLMRTGTPFLPVAIRERRAVIGPFVLPGESSCLSCQEAVRRELDPSWPVIDAQLRLGAHTTGEGGETTLVMLAASLAAVQVLQWVDGERMPETINTTLEIALPELVLERRYWPRHGACPCRHSPHRGQWLRV